MTIPKVLFVTERWTDGNWALYESPYEACLIGPLEYCGLGEAVRFYYDEASGSLGANVPYDKAREYLEARIAELVRTEKPDLLVITHLLPWRDRAARPEFYDQFNIPRCMIWVESSYDVIVEAERFRPHMSFSVVTCHPTMHKLWVQEPEHYLFAVEPRNPGVFNPPLGAVRDIPISLIGTAVRRADRIMLLANLWANGVPVFKAGGREGGHLTTPQYAEYLRRSFSTINTTADATGIHRYTGRATEAMLCGALLFETDNYLTPEYFEPGVDYVPFTDVKDLFEKFVTFSRDTEAAARIAEAGYRKALEERDGRKFWRALFERAGL